MGSLADLLHGDPGDGGNPLGRVLLHALCQLIEAIGPTLHEIVVV